MPVSLLGSVFLLWSIAYPLDVIVLIGMILVLGIVVDDSIIIAENIYRHKEMGKDAVKAVVDGVREVYAPIITTIATTICAFTPMLFMTGIIGKFIFVIPLVVILSLLISLLEITIALPAHLLHINVKKQRSWFKVVENVFYHMIHALLRYRYIVFMAFLMMMVGTIYLAINKSHINIFPSDSVDRFLVNIELPIGSSIEQTLSITKQVEQHLNRLDKKELIAYSSSIGTGGNIVDGTNIDGSHVPL